MKKQVYEFIKLLGYLFVVLIYFSGMAACQYLPCRAKFPNAPAWSCMVPYNGY